ncbi:serine/threonine protein phosphatase [Rhizobium sp. TH2]|uniref:metallophosphoesterase n=1 Tax=Rhizobium sp. TH2 TaxID=2775403 RepID=UPI0021588419|nr:metallophosphoesterase [Rhizobium sp. TH2]UVC08983.1 serine/threonine protein phosphatase [Rhizobium sp. TH2]
MKITTIVPDRPEVFVVAIGDVHGMEGLLDCVLAQVALESIRLKCQPIFVFLGDLIDRGPRSCEVMCAVASTLEQFSGSTLVLGNHDEWLLKFLRTDISQSEFEAWLANGGDKTLKSYVGDFRADFDVIHDIATEINSRFPKHILMLSTASDIVVFGDYAFVHAGIRPGLPLPLQQVRDLRWIRHEFLSSSEDHSHIVVHGHTITEGYEPEWYSNRIALDTGAANRGRLSFGLFLSQGLLGLFQCHAASGGKYRLWSFPFNRLA